MQQWQVVTHVCVDMPPPPPLLLLLQVIPPKFTGAADITTLEMREAVSEQHRVRSLAFIMMAAGTQHASTTCSQA
jgi:hypothetical protein